MTTDIGATFRALHQPGNPFILANAWDIGSAKMLVGLGARAIATSSAAHAFTLGRPDGGQVTRDEALAHAQDLVSAVSVPVSGDFENGFGDDPDTCAETVKLSADVGLAGISIEDIQPSSQSEYDFDLAIERIKAAASAARALPQDFILAARADGVMTGSYDMTEALRRIKAMDDAGADCLYVPLPPDMSALADVVKSTQKPINALAAGPFANVSRAQYAQTGIARISLGSSLARVTHRAIYDAAQSMFGEGDFTPLTNSISGSKIDDLL